jgi:hypothetical protein
MHNAHPPVEQVTSIEHAHVREEMAVNMFTRALTHSSPLCRSQIGSNQPVICPPRRGKQASLVQGRRRDLEFRQRNRGLLFRREGETLNSGRGIGLLFRREVETLNSGRGIGLLFRRDGDTLNSGRGIEASYLGEKERP